MSETGRKPTYTSGAGRLGNLIATMRIDAHQRRGWLVRATTHPHGGLTNGTSGWLPKCLLSLKTNRATALSGSA